MKITERRGVLIDALKGLKEELEKRNEIYQYGIDLANYENGYLKVALELIYFLFDNKIDNEVDWWLFEGVKKVYYERDDYEKIIANVEQAEDFVDYHLKSLECSQSSIDREEYE